MPMRSNEKNQKQEGEKMQAKRNVMIAKAGGTAGKNSKLYRLSLPAGMVKELGVTEEDRAVILSCEDGILTIKKAPEQ